MMMVVEAMMRMMVMMMIIGSDGGVDCRDTILFVARLILIYNR